MFWGYSLLLQFLRQFQQPFQNRLSPKSTRDAFWAHQVWKPAYGAAYGKCNCQKSRHETSISWTGTSHSLCHRGSLLGSHLETFQGFRHYTPCLCRRMQDFLSASVAWYSPSYPDRPSVAVLSRRLTRRPTHSACQDWSDQQCRCGRPSL